MQEDTTFENIPAEDAPSVDDSADGSEAASQGEGENPNDNAKAADDAITLAEIEQTLGKKFPNKAAALKAWKDTNSYVGKKIEPKVPEELVKKITELEKTVRYTTFYAEHPEYKGFEDLVEAYGGPEKALKNEQFKARYEALRAHAQAEESKSVLMSNQRIGQATDKITQAREKIAEARKAAQTGDIAAAQKNIESASRAAVDAVLESYDLRQ